MPEQIPVPFTAKSSDPAFKARANRISDQFLKPPHAHFPVRGEYTAAFKDCLRIGALDNPQANVVKANGRPITGGAGTQPSRKSAQACIIFWRFGRCSARL